MPQDVRKKDSSTMTKMFQDDKTKIFALFDNNYESDSIEKLMKEYITPIKEKKYIGDTKLKKLNPEYMMQLVNTEEDKTFKKVYKDETEKASSTIKFLNKKIKEDPKMPSEKINIINQFEELKYIFLNVYKYIKKSVFY